MDVCKFFCATSDTDVDKYRGIPGWARRCRVDRAVCVRQLIQSPHALPFPAYRPLDLDSFLVTFYAKPI